MSAYVTYRMEGKNKNGYSKQKHKKLGFLTRLYREGNLYEINYIMGRLRIKSNVNFIKIKNVWFQSGQLNQLLCSNNDTTCIIEDCDFELRSGDFILNDGNLRIKNSDFPENTTFRVMASYGSKITLHFDSKEKHYEVNDYRGIARLEIKSNQSIDEIYSESELVYLYGTYILSDLNLRYNRVVSIGDKDNYTSLINNSSKIINIQTEHLCLNNCLIQDDNEESYTNIECQELTGDDFIIKSKGRIKINNVIITDENDKLYQKAKKEGAGTPYYIMKRDEEGYITITKNSLMRVELISSLKAIRERALENVAADAEKNISQNFASKLAEDLEAKTIEAVEAMTELNKAQTKYNIARRGKKDTIIRSLSRRPIKNYLKTQPQED